MPYSTFPSYAQILLDGYQATASGNVERSAFEDGFVHQVPKNSLARYELALTYRLATAEYKRLFEDWRRNTLGNGALYFAWTEPTDPAEPDHGVARRARIVDGEVTYKPVTNRFDDWTVSFTLEFWK